METDSVIVIVIDRPRLFDGCPSETAASVGSAHSATGTGRAPRKNGAPLRDLPRRPTSGRPPWDGGARRVHEAVRRYRSRRHRNYSDGGGASATYRKYDSSPYESVGV